MKLNTRLAISFVTLSTIPMLVLAAVFFFTGKRIITRQVLNSLDANATHIQQRVDALVESYFERFALVASRTQLRRSIKRYYKDGDATELDLIAQILKDAQRVIPDSTAIRIFNRDGQFLTGTFPRPSEPAAPYPAPLLRHDRDVHFTLESDKQAGLRAQLSSGLYLKEELIGYLLVELKLGKLNDLLNKPLGIGESEEVLLAQRSKNGDMVFVFPERFVAGTPNAKARPIHNRPSAPMTYALRGEHLLFPDSTDYRGTAVLATTRHINRVDWGLVLKVDRSEAFTPIRNFSYAVFGVAVLLVIVTFLLSQSIGRKIATPIVRLTDAVKRFHQGNLDDRIEADDVEEINKLGSAFNDLVDTIQTAQQAQQKQLRELDEQQRYVRAMLDSSIDAVFCVDEEGTVIEWNPAAARIFGYSRDEIMGRRIGDVIVPEQHLKRHEEALKQFCRQGTADFFGRRLQSTALNKQKHEFPVELVMSASKLQGRSIITGFIRDLRKSQRERARFEAAVEGAPHGMLMIDKEGHIVLTNEELERQFGYPREELLGQPVEILVPERFSDTHPENRESFFQEPTTRAMGAGRELFGRRKNGTEFPVEIGLNPISTDEGLFVLSSVVDITERKESQDVIKKSLKEKEVLLKEIHHRVKNNLQVISSLLRLQSEYLSDSSAREFFKQSDERVRSMALIHERLYRSEGFAEIDFSDYVEELVHYLHRSYVMNRARISLKLELQNVLLGLDQAIPSGLILNELISNALKHAFTEGDSGEIKVTLREENGRIELGVADTGRGFPSDFDIKNTNSLGFEIINTLCDQLEGKIRIRHTEVTEVVFAFQRQVNKDWRSNHEANQYSNM